MIRLALFALFAVLIGCAPAVPSQATTPATPAPTQGTANVTNPNPFTPAPKYSGARETVHFGGLSGSTDRAIYVAQTKGYFDDQGLVVTVDNFPSATQIIPLLATNKVDAAHGGSSPGLYNAILQGTGIRIVADVTVPRPPVPGVKDAQFVVVRKALYDQGVHTVADLKGKKVAINALGGIGHEQLEYVLKFHGLTLDDVDVQGVTYPEMPVALSNGAVDAAIVVEPFAGQMQDMGIGVEIFNTTLALIDHTATWLFYSQDFMTQRPEVARRFMIAWLEGMRYIEDAQIKGLHRDEAYQIMADNTSVKDVKTCERTGIPYGDPNGEIRLPPIAADQDFFMRMGSMKQRIEPQAAVDTSFRDYAVGVLGQYMY
ncbi:MAG: ABC transporter substrate-binding protein [Chloroflexi bacterium]|nr:ABC transporter substrate-binding protein [Chloroflexota bacterium]